MQDVNLKHQAFLQNISIKSYKEKKKLLTKLRTR